MRAGSIGLGEVAAMLDAATREELKAECGGVQTLLRNHHTIFQGEYSRIPNKRGATLFLQKHFFLATMLIQDLMDFWVRMPPTTLISR